MCGSNTIRRNPAGYLTFHQNDAPSEANLVIRIPQCNFPFSIFRPNSKEKELTAVAVGVDESVLAVAHASSAGRVDAVTASASHTGRANAALLS